MSAERFATISKEKLREIRGHVTVKFSPKISSIRTRCVRETSSLCPKPFGRPKAISIHLSPWTLPLLSTPSTWDFGHRLVLSHFAIIASHFIGDFGRSLLPSPRQFSVKSAPQLVPKTRRHHRHSSTWSQFCQKFVKSTTGWQPHSQRKFRQIISSIEDRGKRSAPCFPQKIP